MPEAQRNLHIITESLAVFILAPILIYIGLKQKNQWYKSFLIILGIGTLIVDGYLLSQWIIP
jgi:hypothetical protein